MMGLGNFGTQCRPTKMATHTYTHLERSSSSSPRSGNTHHRVIGFTVGEDIGFAGDRHIRQVPVGRQEANRYTHYTDRHRRQISSRENGHVAAQKRRYSHNFHVK